MLAKREVPPDFEATFIRIGRLACKEHYQAGQIQITEWLEATGKLRLIEKRAEYVRNRRRANAKARSMKRILDRAFPVPETRRATYAIASRAARHLQCVRNGGWRVSPAGDGKWWVGCRKRTHAELIAMAKKAGFDPSSLSRPGKGE